LISVFIIKLGGYDHSDEVPESEYEDRQRLVLWLLQSNQKSINLTIKLRGSPVFTKARFDLC